MSGLAGIFNWDGAPASAAHLACLAEFLRMAGPDGGGTISPQPEIALQAHVLHFDALSAVERQPHSCEPGIVMTWDGRLDNRDDLLMALHHNLDADITDVAVVAAAYRRWGRDCFTRLIGDWSLALWDAPRQTLLLARDYMGNRPLYYRETGTGVTWATRLEALVECFDLYGAPDESYIAGLLSTGVPRSLTPFASVRALNGGHCLIATRAGITVRRYWQFPAGTIRYRDPREYADRMRELMTDAVRVRLRARKTVWGHLSGGWDSSTIVSLASALIDRRRVEAEELRTVSLRYVDSPESDELRFKEAVAEWCRVPNLITDFVGLPAFPDMPGRLRPFERGFYLFDAIEAPIRASGDRVVLSGEFGDTVMCRSGGPQPPPLELLHEGHPIRFLQMCVARSKETGRPLWSTLAGMFRGGYGSRFRPGRRARAEVAAREAPRSWNPTARLLALRPQPEPVPPVTDFPYLKQWLAVVLYRAAGSNHVMSPDVSPLVWRTYPYAHRPLVEFVLAAPTLAFWAPGELRFGMRRAFVDILPPEILVRTRKVGANAAFTRDRERRFTELDARGVPREDVRRWQLVSRDYVEPQVLRRMLNRVAAPEDKGADDIEHWLNVEVWLRRLATHGSTKRSLPADVPARTVPLGRSSLIPVGQPFTTAQ